MIGSARTLKSDAFVVPGEEEADTRNSEYEIEAKQNIAQLTSDIRQGRIPPVPMHLLVTGANNA